MAIPFLNLRVKNFSDAASGPGIIITVAPEYLATLERQYPPAEPPYKPTYNDGRMRNSRVVYSDEHCEIISNRLEDKLLLYKTLSKQDKRHFHEEAKALVHADMPAAPDTRLEHAVFKADDMYAVQSALETLGLEVKPEFLRTLALALGKSADRGRVIELDPASLDTRRTRR